MCTSGKLTLLIFVHMKYKNILSSHLIIIAANFFFFFFLFQQINLIWFDFDLILYANETAMTTVTADSFFCISDHTLLVHMAAVSGVQCNIFTAATSVTF